MDERIKQGYCKIRSELFLIVFFLAAFSVVVNVTFFEKNITQLWFEYIILVGSPLYQLVRGRMLEIADTRVSGWKNLAYRLTVSVCFLVVLFVAVNYIRFGKVSVLPLIGFMIPFVIMFSIVAISVKKLQENWKKKLDRKYEDKEH